MESARTFLFILFAFLTFLLYQEWQKEHAPVKEPISEVQKKDLSSSAEYELPKNASDSKQPNNSLESELPPSNLPTKLSSTADIEEELISVTTDKLRVMISTKSGDIVSSELLDYKISLDEGAPPINILENRNNRIFRAEAGVFGVGAPDQQRVTTYSAEQTEYQIQDGKEELSVNLSWTNENGVKYIKEFLFSKGSHLIKVNFHIDNQSPEKITNSMFMRLRRDALPNDYEESPGLGMKSALGFAFSHDNESYTKNDFSSFDEDLKTGVIEKITTDKGWISIIQHYFVTAWVPAADSGLEITTKVDKTKSLYDREFYQIRLRQPWVAIASGEKKTLSGSLYVGPKIQSELEKIADGLDLTIDYGWLWWIGQPIFYMLIFFQSFVINWGLAIILVTIAIKTLLYPLARAQYRSFAKMRLLQPKMTAMKEQYGDDRQKMSMKMMELYKKEKVNPLGGCFPLLIQMPVFIALYWVLMESVELRHAPFMLWIDDLSVMDPWGVMPLLMGASMYLMQKMQPMSPTMDPMQQKMMQMMPVFMTVFFVFFPAGLVLYWLMNNLISIAQQLYITKQFNNEQEAKKQK